MPAPGEFLNTSKIASLYNPPVKSPRPFAADYPLGAPADATGRLTADIEGRPLVAEYVAGRRLVHGPDEPLGAPEMVSAATQATGGSPQAVAHSARSEIGGDAGRYIREVDRRSGNVLSRDIFYDNSLPEAKANRVIAHEFGHAIDEIAGRIPTIGLNTELRQVYNTLLTGQERNALIRKVCNFSDHASWCGWAAGLVIKCGAAGLRGTFLPFRPLKVVGG